MTEKPDSELSFRIFGMDCVKEVSVLKREVGPFVGGEDRLSFDLLNGRMIVAGTSARTAAEIIQAVGQAGLRAESWTPNSGVAASPSKTNRWGRTHFTVAGGLFALAGFLVETLTAGRATEASSSGGITLGRLCYGLLTQPRLTFDSLRDSPEIPLYAISLVFGLWPFLAKASLSLRRLSPDMNLLMTVAVIGATAIGEWLEAVTVAFLFGISLVLEAWSVGRARRAISALLDLAPPTARVRGPEGAIQSVPPDEVAVGTVFIVNPGERIPLDGRVSSGMSEVNQAPITGESVPVPKQPDDDIFAGTINGDGTIEATCTKAAGDSTLARIVKLVADAQSRRAPSEQWVEKFARVYTPVVLLISVAVFLIPPLVSAVFWSTSFYNALVLLVIACPCALVISTPVSIVAALAAAAKQGVLLKGGLYVEVPARLIAVALDKTGTITRGRPAVVDVVPLSGITVDELLQRAAAMELGSDHPLATAIVAFAKDRGISPSPAENFQILQGKGATATIAGKPFWLGSHRYLEERGQETPEMHARLESMSEQGRSVVVVGNDIEVCGMISLADEIRPEAFRFLRELRKAGIQHIVMLTGDNKATAERIAQEVGIDEVHAELLPADKVTEVESLVKTYRYVAMVGDGVNDAPALARATIGIAMGAVGSDAAIETADVALMSDDLLRLPWLIHHSRRAVGIIRQNIAFSLGVKAVFLILTLVGIANLWTAIASDMGASFLVIFNGLRLLQPSGLVSRR